VLGLAVISIAALFWPTKSRQAERLIARVAESLSCEGPIGDRRAVELRAMLYADFGPVTTVAIQGPEAVNGSFTREQLFESFAELCVGVSQLHVELSHLSVDVMREGETAQARADAKVEYRYAGRAEREQRQARFSLRWGRSGYQVRSAELLPKVVNQPEPRP
jgi:hypothetical protein